MDLLRVFRRRYRHQRKNHKIDLFATTSSEKPILFKVEVVNKNQLADKTRMPVQAPAIVDICDAKRSGKRYLPRPHDRLLKAMAELEAYKAEWRSDRERAL